MAKVWVDLCTHSTALEPCTFSSTRPRLKSFERSTMVDATARPPRSNGRQRPNGKERKAPRTKAKSHSAASERKRKEKGKARAQEEEEEEPTPRVAREGVEAWPYVQLASAQLDAPPVLYSKDGRCVAYTYPS